MKIWMVASFSGGTPGDSDVDLFLDGAKAKEEFKRRIKDVKSSFPSEDSFEVYEKEENVFYYDAGDIWEYITIEEREVV